MATPTTSFGSLQPKPLSDGSLPSSSQVSFSLLASASGVLTVGFDHTVMPVLFMEPLIQLYHVYKSQQTMAVLGAARLRNVVEDPTGLDVDLTTLGLEANCTFDQWSEKDREQRQLHATLTQDKATELILKRSQSWNNILRMKVHDSFDQSLA